MVRTKEAGVSASVRKLDGYWAGDIVTIRLDAPFSASSRVHVYIGKQPLVGLFQLDAKHIAGRVPKDKAGSRNVRVTVDGKPVKAAPKGIKHRGERVREANTPIRKLLQFADGTKRRPQFHHGGKPGDITRPDSNWWMAGGNLYHDGNGRTVSNINPQAEWSYFMGQYVAGAWEPVVGDGMVIFTSVESNQQLIALDEATGAPIWIEQYTLDWSYAVSSPLAANHRVYILEARGSEPHEIMLRCLAAPTGALQWEVPVAEMLFYSGLRNNAIAAAHGYVYTYTVDGSLQAFDALTGEVVWQRIGELPQGWYNAVNCITIAYGSLIVGSTRGLHGFSPISGEPRWVSPVAFNAVGSPIVATIGSNPPLIVAVDREGKVFAFDAFSQALRWDFDGVPYTMWPAWPTVVTNQRWIYIDQGSTVVALDPANGNLAATSPDFGPGASRGMCVCSNRVYRSQYAFGTSGGQLIVLDSDDLSLVSSEPVQASAYSGPIIEGPRLYLNVARQAGTFAREEVMALRIRQP